MSNSKISIDDVLQVWENAYGKLTTAQRGSFRQNITAHELREYSKSRIAGAIRFGGKKYLKEILEYLRNQDIENTRLYSPARRNQANTKVVGSSAPFLLARECGHRYECSCADALIVYRLIQQAG
jgi:hypothetical protein